MNQFRTFGIHQFRWWNRHSAGIKGAYRRSNLPRDKESTWWNSSRENHLLVRLIVY